MGTCVSRCYPCASSPPSTAGDHSLSLCGGDSPHLHTVAKHGIAVYPLPLASNSPAPTTSTSSSSVLSAASSCNSMATTSSSTATTRSYSSSLSSRPFSAGYLQVRTCRDMMEVVVLDPHRNKRKLPRPASANPRPLLPRTPPALSVVRSPTKKKPGNTSTGRRATAPTATATRRVRPLPPRAPPAGAGAGAGGSASCTKKRLSASSSSCRPADLVGRRKSGGATTAGAGRVGGGELVDDLNNPLISMDCFIFL